MTLSLLALLLSELALAQGGMHRGGGGRGQGGGGSPSGDGSTSATPSVGEGGGGGGGGGGDGAAVFHGRRNMGQDMPPEESTPSNPEPRQGQVIPPDSSDLPASKPEGAPEPMSEGDAKVNFPTVVESYLAQHSPRGYFPVTEKQTKKVWHLKLLEIQTGNLRSAGTNRYTARADFKDVRNGAKLSIDITVDFGGSEWSVTTLKVVRKGSRK